MTVTLDQRYYRGVVTIYFLLSTTTLAFEVGLPSLTRSMRSRPIPTWKTNENPSFCASRFRRMESHHNDHSGSDLRQRRLQHPSSFWALKKLTLTSEKGTSQEATEKLTAELSGAMVRLLAQFVTTELKPVMEQAKHKQVVEETSRQMGQFEATVAKTQEAQEQSLPTWKAAEAAVQENSLTNDNQQDDDDDGQLDGEEYRSDVVASAASTPAPSAAGSLGTFSELLHRHHDEVDSTRNIALFDQFDTETEESTDTSVVEGMVSATFSETLNDSAVNMASTTETSSLSPPSSSVDASSEADDTTSNVSDVSMANGTTETVAALEQQDPSRSVLPRIPTVISMQFGKPLAVVGEDSSNGSWQLGTKAALVEGMGTTTVSPPSMSLSSAMNDSEFAANEEASGVAEVQEESPVVVEADEMISLEEQVSPIEDHVVEDSNTLDGAVAEEATAHVVELPPAPVVPAALTEEELAAKYATIPTLEERAFTILLDLGLIQISPDPDDPNYDHSQDDEFCPENLWIQPRP